jgi:hypothetical protein
MSESTHLGRVLRQVEGAGKKVRMPAPVTRRKCRNEACGKVSILAFMVENCPACKQPYGNWAIGYDTVVEPPTKKGR